MPIMHRKHGVLIKNLFFRFFKDIKYSFEDIEVVQQAAQKGPVIYFMRNYCYINFLYLNYAALEYELPLAFFSNGPNRYLWQPFTSAMGSIFSRQRHSDAELFQQICRQGKSSLLFINRADSFGAENGNYNIDRYLQWLVKIQRESDIPFQLISQMVYWRKIPHSSDKQKLPVTGEPNEPSGHLSAIYYMMRNYKNAFVKIGTPLDMKIIADQHKNCSELELAQKIKDGLLENIRSEDTAVLGPPLASVYQLQEYCLKDPILQKVMRQTAMDGDTNINNVQHQARKYLQEIAARYKYQYIKITYQICAYLWNKIYEGIIVDQKDLEKIRQLQRNNPVLLCPGHKSHIDYLIISWILFHHNMATPYIASGINLSFWPLGPIFRGCGAFFMRRTFKGKQLYSATFKTYIKKLMQAGFTQEFFIEGGRSRTGKVLSPKFGILGMELEAFCQDPTRDIYLIPMSVGYEKIIEEKAYVHELEGGDKIKENISSLLESRKVLKVRYGQIYLNCSKPLSLKKYFKKFGINPDNCKKEDIRQVTKSLGNRLAYEISKASMITPSAIVATVTLTSRFRGQDSVGLVANSEYLFQLLKKTGNHNLSRTLQNQVEIRKKAYLQAAERFVKYGNIKAWRHKNKTIYYVPQELRLALDYYKNNIINFFVPFSLISAAIIVSEHEDNIPLDELQEKVLFFSRLFKYEFVYKTDKPYEQVFENNLNKMVQWRLLKLDTQKGTVFVKDDYKVALLTRLILNFIDSYWAGLQVISHLEESYVQEKEFLNQMLKEIMFFYYNGHIKSHESISKDYMKNLIIYLTDIGIIQSEFMEIKSRRKKYWPLFIKLNSSPEKKRELMNLKIRLDNYNTKLLEL